VSGGIWSWRWPPSGVSLWWQWVERRRQDSVLAALRALKGWGMEAVARDKAPRHTARRVQHSVLVTVQLPPYWPGLDPVERAFQELRRQIEGHL